MVNVRVKVGTKLEEEELLNFSEFKSGKSPGDAGGRFPR